MTRRALFATVFGVTATAATVTARAGFHLTGRMTATETERTEGYFNLGRDLMLASRPGTEPHRILTEMLDREVQVSVFIP